MIPWAQHVHQPYARDDRRLDHRSTLDQTEKFMAPALLLVQAKLDCCVYMSQHSVLIQLDVAALIDWSDIIGA